MRPALRSAGCLLLALGLAACSDDDDTTPGSTPYGWCWGKTPGLVAAAGDPVEPAELLTEEPVLGSACNAVIRSYATSAGHVELCEELDFTTNPPSSGIHYDLWPEYKVYAQAVPRGFTVHSLEHGGVVVSYACSNCAEEVADATDMVQTYPVAPVCCSASGCDSTQTNQLILTPDPGIPTTWAAAAWGYTLTADCFERGVFEAFIEQRRDFAAPERVCTNGSALDVTQRAR